MIEAMRETPEELAALQSLLDASVAGSGSHLTASSRHRAG